MDEIRTRIQHVEESVAETVKGQPEFIRGMLLGLLSGGHVLIEGVPGLAKTTAVAALAKSIQADFRRLQFTPDLLPSDIVGSEIYRPEEHRFEVQQGPIFANLVLVDEINRAPAKVQSALLESMQEGQVSIAGQTMRLPRPFMVLATQNPIDQQGTYSLPEAQLDRFLLKLKVVYPPVEAEREMLRASLKGSGDSQVDNPPRSDDRLSLVEIEQAKALIRNVEVGALIEDYILGLVNATRGSARNPSLRFGVSPRGTIALAHVARTHAFLEGRNHVVPDDVKQVVKGVFNHRIVLSYEALADGISVDDVLEDFLRSVPVP
jgi:MoxR-like ATPase